MRRVIAVAVLSLSSVGALAHSIADDIAAFEKIYATKDPTTPEAKAAKVAIERGQADYYHSDVIQKIRIQDLTNGGFKAIGGQPAFPLPEIQRLEQAINNAKGVEPAKLEEAKKLLKRAKEEKLAYDALHDSSNEQLKLAKKLIETAK